MHNPLGNLSVVSAWFAVIFALVVVEVVWRALSDGRWFKHCFVRVLTGVLGQAEGRCMLILVREL